MLAAAASATLIVAGSLGVGQAVLSLCGRREWSWCAGPVGLAVLLAVAAITAHAGGRGTACAIAVGCVFAAAVAYLAYAGPGAESRAAAPVAAAVLAALVAALPFIAAGAVGVLGVGLVNDDMASHLLIADWIDERFHPEPVFIDQGYPLGPHALVIGLATVLHADTADAFAGLVLAVPALTALVAFAALSGVRPVARTLASVVVSLPYMAAAYLAQEAFKEPLLALFLLGFALLLPTVRRPLDAIPLGLLGAGTVYIYSFPGLAWLVGTAIVWLAIGWVRERRLVIPPLALGLGIGAAVLAIAPEMPRLLDFIDFRALHPDRANEGGLGNLREQLSPLTAFGIWPTSEFRLPAGAGSLPAAAFYLGAAVGAFALALALPRWLRRYGPAIPAALLTAACLYVFARVWGTVYTSAKAISIIAPLITLIIAGGLLANGKEHGPFRLSLDSAKTFALPALGAVVLLATAFSSFLILRQAPVGPEAHAEELAEIRPIVQGRKVLFLGRDNFILHELRGARPFVATRNFYVPKNLYAPPNDELDDPFSKFDFDTVTAETLEKFPYVLTTRAAYASGPPPSFQAVAVTPTYVLWRNAGPVGPRKPAESGIEPGAKLECGSERPGEVIAIEPAPIVIEPEEWSTTTVKNGEEAVAEVEVPQGAWDVSLQYDSTRPITVKASGSSPLSAPGNLDFRGPAPFYPLGAIAGTGASTRITVTVERPPLVGRLLGARSVAHLGPLALTPRFPGRAGGLEPPYPGAGARLLSGERACGKYVDWIR